MTLFEAVQVYVERKRSLGLDYTTSRRELVSFARDVGNIPIDSIVARSVASHLDRPQTSVATWRVKYSVLRNFFEYWAARGVIDALPMPPVRPAEPHTFVPYIYQRSEIRTLLTGTRRSQRDSCRIDATTLRALLLFLYGTGALVGEALRLLRDDVDLTKGLITIRGSRFNRVRRIPIGPDLQSKLFRYVRRTARKRNEGLSFFANRDGSPIKARILAKSFARLRRMTGIVRHDGASYQPRLHDLRHTFAVHRVTLWFKQRADMNRMLPALSAYMGQAGPGSTERYLALTPERFRKQLVKLSPASGRRKHWRDDPALMKFLAEL